MPGATAPQGRASVAGSGMPEATGLSALSLRKLAGHFDWRRHPAGWRLDADRVILARASDTGGVSAREEMAAAQDRAGAVGKKINFKVAVAQQDTSTVVEMGAQGLRLQDGVTMLLLSNLLDDAAREALTTISPSPR